MKDQRVECVIDVGPIKKGMQGLCTADWGNGDIFAIRLDEAVWLPERGEMASWIRFPYAIRDHFKMLGAKSFKLGDKKPEYK